MSANLKRNMLVLRALAMMPKRQRLASLATCPNGLILALCELVDNILHGTVRLSQTERERLHRYRRILRELADRKISVKQKRHRLVQKGGAVFLPLLLGALPSIISLVSDLVRKK